MYRKLMGPGWAAGLAGLLFLLDDNTYFPVAFVANRGFILSLCLGLACLYQHHQWRAEQRRSGLIWSELFLALAVSPMKTAPRRWPSFSPTRWSLSRVPFAGSR